MLPRAPVDRRRLRDVLRAPSDSPSDCRSRLLRISGRRWRGATSSCTRTPRMSSCARSAETVFRDPERVPDDLLACYRDDSYSTAELERLWSNGLAGLDVRRTRSPPWGCSRTRRSSRSGATSGSFLTLASELGCGPRSESTSGARSSPSLVPGDWSSATSHSLPSVSDRGASTVCGSSIASNSFLIRGRCSTTSRRSCGLVDRGVIRTPNADFVQGGLPERVRSHVENARRQRTPRSSVRQVPDVRRSRRVARRQRLRPIPAARA